MSNCDLCLHTGGEVICQNDQLRVVLVDDANYPGFCRVIWHDHIKEMTDLSPLQRRTILETVFKVETALRDHLQPEKINVASLGNMTPHVHWHVIPRFVDDAHFPNPVWGPQQRESDPRQLAARRAQLDGLKSALAHALA